MVIRKADSSDIDAVAKIYDATHTAEEAGKIRTGWIRGIYPVKTSAERAEAEGHLFVLEEAGRIEGAGIINQIQHPSYRQGLWTEPARPEDVMVLHTLVIDPACAARGLGREFLRFYVDYALAQGCKWLRLDTNEINQGARAFYRRAGFREAGVVRTSFNGIGEINLVLLEGRTGEIKRQLESKGATAR